jgi:hypothetical protein
MTRLARQTITDDETTGGTAGESTAGTGKELREYAGTVIPWRELLNAGSRDER